MNTVSNNESFNPTINLVSPKIAYISPTLENYQKALIEHIQSYTKFADDELPELSQKIHLYLKNESADLPTAYNTLCKKIMECATKKYFFASSLKKNILDQIPEIQIETKLQRISKVVKRWQIRQEDTEQRQLFLSKIISNDDVEKLKENLHHWYMIQNATVMTATAADERQEIRQSMIITELLYIAVTEMENDKNIAEHESFHLVHDREANLQSAALFKHQEKRKIGSSKVAIPTYIAYIGTAPWNLKTKITASPTQKTTGAGTALIEEAIFESIKMGYKGAVALESVPTAVAFYEKLGFKKASWTAKEKGCIPMELSAVAAQQFLESERAGRAMPTII